MTEFDWREVYMKIHEELEKRGIDADDLDLVECLDKTSSNQYYDIYLCIHKNLLIAVWVEKDSVGNYRSYDIQIEEVRRK